MSELPRGWAISTIGEICAPSQYGFTAKAKSLGDVHFLRTTDITSGDINWASVPYCDVPKSDMEKYLLKDGDVVISRAGSVGYSHVLKNPQRSVFASYLIRFRPLVSAEYFGYFLKTPVYWEAISEQSLGIAVQNVNATKLAEIPIPIAPATEQDRIVEKLEELLSDVEAGVAELKAAQRKLAQYRQSLLKAAVEGALTADWRAAHNKPEKTGAELLQRILSERRARWEQKQLAKFAEQGKAPQRWRSKYQEPIAPDFSELPTLPDGWVWASVDQLAGVGTGATPLRSNRDYFDSGEIPWTTSGALNDEVVTSASEHVTKLAVSECRLELYPAGTLLVAMYGEGKTRGKCAELAFPSTINQAIAAIGFEGAALEVRPHVKTFFLDAYEAMRQQASGGVQPNLNLQIIKALPVPLPPLEEQSEIQEQLQKQLFSYGRFKDSIEMALAQAAAQRKNVLKAAFAGQLVPQDPSDEPASELLARIRAERASNDGSANRRRRKSA